jgi:hypothetical protein
VPVCLIFFVIDVRRTDTKRDIPNAIRTVAPEGSFNRAAKRSPYFSRTR